jgi:cytoskeletal protein CcmA (bactofilin family)
MLSKKFEKERFVANGPMGGSAVRSAGPPQVPNARGPAGVRAQQRGSGASIIGPDLAIVGNLECRGEVQIEGEVQGDIHAGRIVIGEGAHVVGALIAEEIVVRGSVQGSIRGNHVTFQAASRIEGDVFHKSLAIEQGAFFEGKSRRTENPMAVQRSAEGMPPPAA